MNKKLFFSFFLLYNFFSFGSNNFNENLEEEKEITIYIGYIRDGATVNTPVKISVMVFDNSTTIGSIKNGIKEKLNFDKSIEFNIIFSGSVQSEERVIGLNFIEEGSFIIKFLNNFFLTSSLYDNICEYNIIQDSIKINSGILLGLNVLKESYRQKTDD